MMTWLGKQWLSQTDKQEVAQEVTHSLSQETVGQIANLKIDDLIAMGNGLKKVDNTGLGG